MQCWKFLQEKKVLLTLMEKELEHTITKVIFQTQRLYIITEIEHFNSINWVLRLYYRFFIVAVTQNKTVH